MKFWICLDRFWVLLYDFDEEMILTSMRNQRLSDQQLTCCLGKSGFCFLAPFFPAVFKFIAGRTLGYERETPFVGNKAHFLCPLVFFWKIVETFIKVGIVCYLSIGFYRNKVCNVHVVEVCSGLFDANPLHLLLASIEPEQISSRFQTRLKLEQRAHL